MILAAIAEARDAGARLSAACHHAGRDARTVQRWLRDGVREDGRVGPTSVPHNRLTAAERRELIEVANSPEYRDLSPKQIVPKLADSGRYIASESSMYRVLKQEKLDAARGKAKPREARRVEEHIATGPNQVWSWDITYLKSPTRGVFYYLYLIVDVWSRKAVGAHVATTECGELASDLVQRAVLAEGADPELLVLHQDNGGPMKGATLKATLESLGIVASYSRPRVSDDNPYSEALFRTLKYRPEYPSDPFQSLDHARKWVDGFLTWYNTVHLHSAIGFVAPVDRHEGNADAKLAQRRVVYEAARKRHPERWSRGTRTWSAPATVVLNPGKRTKVSSLIVAQAA